MSLLLSNFIYDIAELVQERRNSIVNALELHLSGINPSIYCKLYIVYIHCLTIGVWCVWGVRGGGGTNTLTGDMVMEKGRKRAGKDTYSGRVVAHGIFTQEYSMIWKLTYNWSMLKLAIYVRHTYWFWIPGIHRGRGFYPHLSIYKIITNKKNRDSNISRFLIQNHKSNHYWPRLSR